jgi:hypothetical protein
MHDFLRGRSSPQNLGCILLYFYKNLPKENNHPIGKNSPNLVTLALASD